jgi:hypothetical protein
MPGSASDIRNDALEEVQPPDVLMQARGTVQVPGDSKPVEAVRRLHGDPDLGETHLATLAKSQPVEEATVATSRQETSAVLGHP